MIFGCTPRFRVAGLSRCHVIPHAAQHVIGNAHPSPGRDRHLDHRHHSDLFISNICISLPVITSKITLDIISGENFA